MNDQQLSKANIENLTQLWKKMGAVPSYSKDVEKFQMSVSWPYRCWFEQELDDDMATIVNSVTQAADNPIISIWEKQGAVTDRIESILLDGGFEVLFEQTAMYLDLESYSVMEKSDLELLSIISGQDIQTWTNIAAQSFDYYIDNMVIQKLAVHPEVQLFTAYIGDQPVATAMLFITGDLVGVHQVGVLPEYRGRGVARKLMQDVINLCVQMPARYIMLQASNAGKPLYESLDFKRQFKIKNYQRSIRTES